MLFCKTPSPNVISYITNSLMDEIKTYYANDDFLKVHLKAWLRKLGLLMRFKFNLDRFSILDYIHAIIFYT